MTDTIQLDLNDLTQAHLDEAQPNCGEPRTCLYSAPCIIGTIVPDDRRDWLDNHGDSSIDNLEAEGLVEFPDDEQSQDARIMQAAFDRGDWGNVLNIARKYVK